jgi:thiamine-phosphate pyrophosphorylase
MGADPRTRALRGLYAITPEEEDTEVLARKVAASLAGGAAMVQYRAKALPEPLRLEQAKRLAALCRAHGVPLVVNDDVALALAAGADGVHLGRDDGDIRRARAAMDRGLLGISCYGEPERARSAASSGADYVAIGSVFPSTTKPAAVRAPLALIAEARRVSGLPVVAIGGITAANARLAVEAGADMVAVISAIFDADDIEDAARAIARAFEPGGRNVRPQPRAV